MSDMQKTIELALVELGRFRLPWAKMVEAQLKYCTSVINENDDPAKLEELNMGLIAVREIDEKEDLHSYLLDIQSHMQRTYLPFSAKVRLGIQRK
ncbi:MAG: immunity protein Tsi6 family protein [Halioglobus sp.]